jgi:hypothetical protein
VRRASSSGVRLELFGASFCATIRVAVRLFHAPVLCQDTFHPRKILAQPVGFTQRLFVIVGDRHQETKSPR